MKLWKKMKEDNRIWDYMLFGVLLLAYTVITFVLFHRQSHGSEMLYHSDIKAYILEMQGLDSGYPFPYPLFFKLGAFFHLFISSPELSIVIALTILNTLSIPITKYYADKVILPCIETDSKKKDLLVRLSITLLVFALFFVSMIFSILGIQLPGIFRRYRGVFSPNPFHNATYMATRPFAILTFFVYVRLLAFYEKKTNVKDHILFTVVLFLTTITKPSFTFIMVPAAGLIMLYRLLKNVKTGFLPALKLGICFIPTFCALLYQFFGVFAPTDGGENGIGIGIATSWKYHCTNIPLAIVLGMAFPLAVLVLNVKELKKNGYYRFAWQITLVSLVEVLFFYEKGYRIKDLNFAWGYMHGMFFAFVASAFMLMSKTWPVLLAWKGAEGKEKPTVLYKLLLLGQWALFAWHLLCGLWYFRSVMLGELYY